MVNEYSFHDLRLVNIFRRADHGLTDAIFSLWTRNAILPQGARPDERIKQVVLAAVNSAGTVIGVNTVYIDQIKLPDDSEPLPSFIYRMFIEPQGRQPNLMRAMTVTAMDILGRERTPDDPKRFVIIAENPGLSKPAMIAMIERNGLQRVGTTTQGHLVFVKHFV